MSIVKIFSAFLNLILNLLGVAGQVAEAVNDRKDEIASSSKRMVDATIMGVDSVTILAGKGCKEVQKGCDFQGYSKNADLEKILEYSEAVKNSRKALKKEIKDLKKAANPDQQKIKDKKDQLDSLKSYGLKNFTWD